jgi:adenine-specific DNA-methyltransferase
MQPKLALKQHFTDAKDINQLMCHLLGKVEGRSVLEPSVGHGAFLRGLNGKPSRIDVVDVDASALAVVEAQFPSLSPNVYHTDFIDLFVGDLLNGNHPVRNTLYDFVISNPPYGLYFDLEYRKEIKRAFPSSYARESYGLFFTFAVNQLKQGGRYVFLMPDTFLSSVNHRPLRAFICKQAAPTEIIRFPSKLFETVNFGYANLCIVAGEKKPLCNHDSVRWLDLFDKSTPLSFSSIGTASVVTGQTLLQSARLGWSSAMLTTMRSDRQHQTLGDIAECRTGIYTGDNERFIAYDPRRVMRRLNGHAVDWTRTVLEESLNEEQRVFGLSGDRVYVPLVRGGHREPFARTAWAIDWKKETIEFYKSNKKARFQNSQFYFKPGLAVPMVATKRISASLMENAVFDQGVVGVFPHSPRVLPALLLYLNSTIASERLKVLVNGSANNSANYLKRLPLPAMSVEDIELAARLVENARAGGTLSQRVCDTFVGQCDTALPTQVAEQVGLF